MTKIKLPTITENEDLKKKYNYSSDNEINANRPLVIGVHAPYQIKVIDERKFVISTKLINGQLNMDDIRSKLQNAAFVYDPFEKFDIEMFLNTVTKLDLQNEEAIIDFYNQYGPIAYEGYLSTSGIGEVIDSTNRKFGIHVDTTFESLEIFRKEIAILQDLIHIYDAIENDDEEFLRSFKPLAKYALLPDGQLNPAITKEKLFHTAKQAILFASNEKSNLINSVNALVNGEFIRLSSASCLLGVFYTRLSEFITKENKIYKCQYCGDYFKPRKDNANFCPPPEANQKSKCVNRYDSMVRRIAKWHFQDGLTVEEIQKKITKPKPRTKKEIQSILDNYKGKLKK